MSSSARNFIRRLPKAELHVHLEGSVTPELLLELGRKYSSEYAQLSLQEIRTRLFQYENFSAFLNTYRVVCEHLREPADYLMVLEHLLHGFQEQNIRYAEVIYTPSIAWKMGRDGKAILMQLLDRCTRFHPTSAISIHWILDCVRQWGREAADKTAHLAEEFRGRGVKAIGLGGDENSLPLEGYRETFAWARAHGLFCHVHAGETGGPEQVWGAIHVLGANRIGHGFQAARDAGLMEYLREHALGLDICLTSNIKTRAWGLLSSHPFQLLYRRGVPVTLNTDDPGLFETSLPQEYEKAAQLGLQRSDLARIALQSVQSAFLAHPEKTALMQQFQDEIYQLGKEDAETLG
ncbi:MAG: adenosine deaminase [Acidobacteria bacterium]|nr:adenosine deaminase [Acidobacteriota bacterium]